MHFCFWNSSCFRNNTIEHVLLPGKTVLDLFPMWFRVYFRINFGLWINQKKKIQTLGKLWINLSLGIHLDHCSHLWWAHTGAEHPFQLYSESHSWRDVCLKQWLVENLKRRNRTKWIGREQHRVGVGRGDEFSLSLYITHNEESKIVVDNSYWIEKGIEIQWH